MNTEEWIKSINALTDQRLKDKELVTAIDFLFESLDPLNILGRIVGYMTHHKERDEQYGRWANSIGRVFDQLKDGQKDVPDRITVRKTLLQIECQIRQLKETFE